MLRSLNNSLVFIFISSLSFSSFAQGKTFLMDIQHINVNLSVIGNDPYKRPYIYKNETLLIKKINPIGLLFGGSLYVYQNIISKHISADCLFSPSCSEFGKLAIKEEGILKGTLLTIDRVNRCNIIAAQDLKHYSRDTKTLRYPDPVSRHKKSFYKNE